MFITILQNNLDKYPIQITYIFHVQYFLDNLNTCDINMLSYIETFKDLLHICSKSLQMTITNYLKLHKRDQPSLYISHWPCL